MGFRQDAFARVWSVTAHENYSTANITVSRKSREDESKYEVVFKDGYTRFVGEAHKKISDVTVGDGGISIKILSCDVENRYDADKKKLYTNYMVFDFEFPDSNGGGKTGGKSSSAAKSSPKTSKPAPAATEADEEELPF